MGIGVFFHHIGTLLLLVATALLIVSDVSAPVVKQLSIMHVSLGNDNYVNYGSWGYCVHDHVGDSSNWRCTDSHIGYDPMKPLEAFHAADFSTAGRDTAKALTNVMVLHGVATGLAFIGFLLCLGTGFVGSLVASLFSLVATIVTVVVLVTDFVGWSIVKKDVHDSSNNSAHASYGPAIWCVLAAGVCTLVASVLVFVTCCAGRIRDRRHTHHRRSHKGLA